MGTRLHAVHSACAAGSIRTLVRGFFNATRNYWAYARSRCRVPYTCVHESLGGSPAVGPVSPSDRAVNVSADTALSGNGAQPLEMPQHPTISPTKSTALPSPTLDSSTTSPREHLPLHGPCAENAVLSDDVRYLTPCAGRRTARGPFALSSTAAWKKIQCRQTQQVPVEGQ